jgi:hypothetical protein
VSALPGRGRLISLTLAIVIGFLIGLGAAAYLVFVWVPADAILRDASPRYLRFDTNGDRPDYRDVYVAYVATRYARDMAIGQPESALLRAQQALGIASGDVTPVEALAMVRSAEQAAKKDVDRGADGINSGWFSPLELEYIRQLADRLEMVKDQPVNIPETVVTARRNLVVTGTLLLLLWIGALTALALLAIRLLRLDAEVTIAQPAAGGWGSAPAPFSGEAVVDGTFAPMPASAAAPTEVGYAPSPTSRRPAGAPVATVSEKLVGTFQAVYDHGDEQFEESFDLSTSEGFLGDCGTTVAERLNVASPAPVVALLVWVFDREDLNSANKLLLSPLAFYGNKAMRDKLTSQYGQQALVEVKEGTFEIRTTALRTEIEVRNLQLAELENIPGGYFQHVELTFRVYYRGSRP